MQVLFLSTCDIIHVEILNEAEPDSSHVGVLTEAYLLSKDVTHTRDRLKITRDKLEDSSWQNSYTEIPLTLHNWMS